MLPGAFGGYPYPRSAPRWGVCEGVIYCAYSVACLVCEKMKMMSFLTCILNLKQIILISYRQGAIALNPCCCVWCPLRIEPWNRGCEFFSHQRYVSALSVTVCYFLLAFVLCVEEGKDSLQNFGCKAWRKSRLGSTVYVWMIILKWVLKEIGWKDVEWVNFTAAGTSARLFWTWQWSFALHNPRGIIPSLADKLFNN